ncbi:MAG: tetratricopeptide repeat protein [Candidatus Eremiobacterota bacterium]
MAHIEERVNNIIEYNKKLWEQNLLEGNVPLAIEIMCRIGDIFPDKSESLYELIKISRKILKLYPDDMDIYYFIAICYIKLYDFGLATVAVRKALRLNRDTVRFYKLLAYLYIRTLDIPQAIDIYKKLMELVPEEENYLLFSMGFAYLCMNNIEEAVKIWKETIKKYPHCRLCESALEFIEKGNIT